MSDLDAGVTDVQRITKAKPGVLCMGLMVVSAVAWSDSFYCGQWIASEDMSVGELLTKCGQPTRKESETVDIRSRTDSGRGSIKRGETTVERWIYDLGSQRAAMVVTVADGQIQSIEPLK
jgi:hypothetical protein